MELPSPSQTLTLAAALAVMSTLAEASSSSALAPPKSLLDSDKPLSRHRRFFIPTSGASLNMFFTLVVPIRDAVWPVLVTYPYTLLLDDFTGRKRRKRRSSNPAKDHEEMRYGAIKGAEKFIQSAAPKWLNVHSCFLRLLCEVAQTPLHVDGMLGQMMNALLMPEHLLDYRELSGVDNEYLEAQIKGQRDQDCSDYHLHCPFSLFEFEDEIENYFKQDADFEEDNLIHCSNDTLTEFIPDFVV